MGKRTFITGIITGATIGALVSLLNEDARKYVKDSLCSSRDTLSYYAKNPTVAVNTVRETMLTLNETIDNNTGNAVNALTQVENSLNKVLK